MQVPQCTLYSDNPYHRLLFAADGRYQPVRSTVADAIEGGGDLLHVHWEEHVLRDQRTATEAELSADYFIGRLKEFAARGGRIVWTIHNARPHEGQYMAVFTRLQVELGRQCDRVMVHNLEAARIAVEELGVPQSRLYYLPHPSYLGIYEAEARTAARVRGSDGKRVLLLGKLRRYKGIEFMLEALFPVASPGEFDVHIAGETLPNDEYGQELLRLFARYPQVEVDMRRIEDSEIADLVTGARCVLLPYERFLTSGVALLALTFGTPVVAPDTRQLREVLPAAAHEFLFEPSNADDLRAKTRALIDLSEPRYAQLVESMLQRAAYLHPSRAAKRLADLYDSVRVQGKGP